MLTKSSSTTATSAKLPTSTGTAFGVQDPETIPPESQTSNKETAQDEDESTESNDRTARCTSSRKVKKGTGPKAGPSSETEDSDDEEVQISQSDIDNGNDGTSEFIAAYWNGVHPVPKGTISKRFAVATQEEQFANANDLLEISEAREVNVKL